MPWSIVSRRQLTALVIVSLATAASAAPAAAADPAVTHEPSAQRSPEVRDSDASILEKVEMRNRRSAAALLAEVEFAVRQARARMADDPAAAERDLKLLIERVAKAPQLSAVARANVRGRLTAVMREAQRRAASQASLDAQHQANQAEAGARLRLEEDATQRQEKTRQLTDRYQSLVDEGRNAEANRLGETELRQAAPDSPVAASAPLVAEAIGNRALDKAHRDARTRALFDFYAAEQKAAIPGSDEQPIIYPDAEVWNKLTAWRLAHSATDNRKLSPAAVKIDKALKAPTTVEFDQTPLSDAIDYLKDLHGIEIQFDSKELEQVGIRTDLPVSGTLKGIPLRSVLRLILRPMELTYLVTDDVVLITTRDRASRAVDTRVYPVGDLIFSRKPLFPFGPQPGD